MDESATLWSLRPRVAAFTGTEPGGSAFAQGLHFYFLTNLDNRSCTESTVGGRPAVHLGRPRWSLRGGAFGAWAVRFQELGLNLGGALDVGVDYHVSSSWSVGPTLHTLVLVDTVRPVPVLLGGGVRLGLLDLLSLSPFVQWDAVGDYPVTYGAWLTFDLGTFGDLGLRLSR